MWRIGASMMDVVTTRARWLHRGVRWRVVGRLRKLQWFYRGVRWRVIGRWRKLHWFGRRWRDRTKSRFEGAGRLGLVAVVRSQLVRGATRQVFEDLDGRFDQLLASTGLDLGGPRWARRLLRTRLRRRLFRELDGVAGASEQVARVEIPIRWNRALASRISSARFVELSTAEPDPDAILWTVMPILVSGRPVASPIQQAASPGRLLEYRSADLRGLDEHGLAKVALEQLRALLVGAPGHVRDARPMVSVVLSTTRQELVAEAVNRIQCQRDVEIELIIGCHGFDPEEIADLDLEAGAVRAAKVVRFDSSTVFGDVLRALSAEASSPFLAKWDDDDLYGVHHVFDLWLFAVLARAPMVGKAAEFVLLESAGLLVRRRGGRPYRTTRFLAGGALLMSRLGLELVGGWGSIPRSVDQDVIRRFDEAGLSPFRIHGYEFVLVRHHRGHTWDVADGYFEAAADEIRSTDAIAITHVVAPEIPQSTVAGVPGELDPTFEICVPNHNQPASVVLFERQCDQMTPRLRVTICDDRSDPPLALSLEGQGIHLVRAPAALGFGTGRSRQTAFEHSESDVIVFADADMYIEPEAMAGIADIYRRGFEGVVHAEISFTEVTAPEFLLTWSARSESSAVADLRARRQPGQDWRERHWSTAADYSHPISSSYRATVGAFLVIDRASYVAAGGFRDVPVRGVEDIEFGYRLQASGCPQRLWRSGGIWHLGERTFAKNVDAVEQNAKNIHLSAYVPIWARSLRERRMDLEGWSAPVVPFVELPAGMDLFDELDEEFGVGAAVQHGASLSMLSAPFAVADVLVPAHAVRSIDKAFNAFRNRRGGEVILLSDGQQVGRFVAVWALNLVARRAGDRGGMTSSPLSDRGADLRRLIRRDFGTCVVSID